MSASHLSKEFFELVKSIGESRSKQEEDKIILNEVQVLKAKMSAKDVPPKRMKEYIIRMLYVEMLGHDASFGHIHAVKLCHSRTLIEKRVGYLGVALTLHKDHNFMLLLINTLQTDLKSENYLECSMALIVCCKLINVETIPAILPLIIKLLDHKEGNVRKKAVMALHRFHQLEPSSIQTLGAPIRKALCDSHISVMGSSLNLFLDLVVQKPNQYKDLVPDFVSILKQVIEHRLPPDYDYHRMPAPWIQLKLLQILSVLGNADKAASEGMYEILHEVMKRADIGTNVGYAIVYEAVRTVTSIYPDASLIEDAAKCISKFITSENHNLKYLGINALASIVQIDSKYAVEHQLVVIDCMQDSDETLKRKTLDLLYSMTNPQNVVVIVDKLIESLNNSADNYLRTELVSRITQLAEKFAPSNQWYIHIMNCVLEQGSELIRADMAHSVMRLISESGGALDGGEDIRAYAVDTYISLLQSKRTSLPDTLIQVISWVLGEFGDLSNKYSKVEILNELVDLLEQQVEKPELTKAWLLSAVTKLLARLCAAQPNSVPPTILDHIAKYQHSLYVDLQQRSHECLELIKNTNTMSSCFPPNSFRADDLVIDRKLSFLDAYVQTALAHGAKPYVARTVPEGSGARAHSTDSANDSNKQGLKFTPYTAPPSEIQVAAPAQPTLYDTYNQTSASFGTITPAPAANAAVDDGLKLQGVRRLWSSAGYNEQQTPAPAPEPTPAATPQPTIAQLPSPAAPSPKVEEKKATPVPAKPRELTEKEKLASSLFAGIGGAGGATSASAAAAAAGTRRTPSTNYSNPSTQTPPQAAAPVVDLLGASILDNAAPAPVSSMSPAAATPLDALFGSTPQQAPAPTAQSGSGDIFEILGSSIPANNPAPISVSNVAKSPAASYAAPEPSDPFSALMGTPAPASSASPAFSSPSGNIGDLSNFGAVASVERVGAANMSAQFNIQLSSLDKSNQGQDQVLLNDQRVHISSYRAYASDATLLVLFITNRTGIPLQNVSINLTLPHHVHVQCNGDPAPSLRAGTSANQQILFFPAIQAKQTCTQLISLQVKELVFVNQPIPFQIHGNVVFSGQAAPLNFSCAVELIDFLRPMTMKTEQYGALWKQYTEEVKSSVRSSTQYILFLSLFLSLYIRMSVDEHFMSYDRLRGRIYLFFLSHK